MTTFKLPHTFGETDFPQDYDADQASVLRDFWVRTSRKLQDTFDSLEKDTGSAVSALEGRLDNREGFAAASGTRAAASSTNLTTSYVTYLTADATPVGTKLLVAYYFVYSNDNSGADRTISIRLQADGVGKGQDRTLNAPLTAGTNHRITASGTHLLTGLTAGNTYTLNVDVLASAGAAVSIREGELTVIEV